MFYLYFMDTFQKAVQLRNAKWLATGLFLLMLAVYVLMIYCSGWTDALWIGYVKAFSEAAMVGALADWFAVTALFHHPLGIPVPHTNLIEKSQKKIGHNLGDFVVANFLSPESIRPYIRKVFISRYVATWLEKESNKALLITELSLLLEDIIAKTNDESVTALIAREGKSLIGQIKLNLVVANALCYFIEHGEHEKPVTLLAGKIKEYIRENEDMVREKVKEESFFFIPKFVDNKLASKIANGLIRYFDEIEKDPGHKIRTEISAQLFLFAKQLRTESQWEEEFQRLKDSLLSAEQFHKYALAIWSSLKKTIRGELADKDSALKRYLGHSLDELAHKLKTDKALREKTDHWIRHNAYKLILRNTENVSALISNTVGNWQGRELSRKLELEVGKDLQFIRINGTVVGGLVGLLIYALTRLFS